MAGKEQGCYIVASISPPQSHEERKKSTISTTQLVLWGLLALFCSFPPCLCCITLFTLVSSEQHVEAQAPRNEMSCHSEPSHRLSLSFSVCICLSVCLSLSLPLPRLSRCHIMSLSPTGHVSTCRLGPGPSLCRGGMTSGEVSELIRLGNWFHLHYSDWDTQRRKQFCAF